MVIHPSYYDACDVIYYVIAIRARTMVRIFFLPYLGNRSKSDPCSFELFCLESHILSFRKVLQIPPESPCIYAVASTYVSNQSISEKYETFQSFKLNFLQAGPLVQLHTSASGCKGVGNIPGNHSVKPFSAPPSHS